MSWCILLAIYYGGQGTVFKAAVGIYKQQKVEHHSNAQIHNYACIKQ